MVIAKIDQCAPAWPHRPVGTVNRMSRLRRRKLHLHPRLHPPKEKSSFHWLLRQAVLGQICVWALLYLSFAWADCWLQLGKAVSSNFLMRDRSWTIFQRKSKFSERQEEGRPNLSSTMYRFLSKICALIFYNELSYTMRTNLLNFCHLVSISKNVVFYVSLVVRIY